MQEERDSRSIHNSFRCLNICTFSQELCRGLATDENHVGPRPATSLSAPSLFLLTTRKTPLLLRAVFKGVQHHSSHFPVELVSNKPYFHYLTQRPISTDHGKRQSLCRSRRSSRAMLRREFFLQNCSTLATLGSWKAQAYKPHGRVSD